MKRIALGVVAAVLVGSVAAVLVFFERRPADEAPPVADRAAVVAVPPVPVEPAPTQEKEPAKESPQSALAALDSSGVAPDASAGASIRQGGKASGLLGGGGVGFIGSGSGGGGVGLGVGSASGRGMGSAPASGGSFSVMNLGARGGGADPSSGEGYRNYGVNGVIDTAADRLSTFSIDVDTASYTIARRKLLEGTLPPKDSVRVEEFLNYFNYGYSSPENQPFSVRIDAAPSPFDDGRTLVRVGVQGRRLKLSERKPAHLTFLVDVSGSMQSPDKLPLAKKALRLLVDNLRDGDTVGLVTYAGSVREVLKPTGLEQKALIHEAIEELTAGGSTAMASGIDLAYQQASRSLGPDSSSRVIILSDGDANVGRTSHAELLASIAGHVKEGVTLSVVGFGMGNYKDDLMEQFADKGNGNYAYVDSLFEARRIFQEKLGGTLEVIAQDVKLQVEFNPEVVRTYRLVGYENRDIADRDFRNDKVDAGEIGSGHSVTALYEVELVPAALGALATVRVRAKKPRGTVAQEWAFPLERSAVSASFEAAAVDLRFATAVMGAAEILRASPHAKGWSLARVEAIARETAENSAERLEFVKLLEKARDVLGGVASH